ncbi:MAG: hypothetical protein VX519_12505 [Myxococcota bacterium]|nr:hypothetical protein [Myxococcota bacterium]
MNKKISSIFAGVALLFSQSAWANEAVVTPFLAKSVNSLVALNITSLVASELDFMSEYDMVEQLEQAPSGLSLSCITRSSCLGPIGRNAGASHVFAGSVGKAGSDAFELKLVLFDVPSNAFVRQKTFRVPSAPDRMADTMGGIVRELVTGKSQVQTQQEESVASADDFTMDDEDDFADFGEDDISHRVGVPGNSSRELEDLDPFDSELESRKRAEEEAQRQAEAAERRRAEEEDRRRAEEERRQRAEKARQAEEEARRAEEERLAWQREEEDRRRQEARIDEEDRRSNLDDIQFGAVEEDDIGIDDIEFGTAVSSIMIDESSSDSAGYEDDLDDYRDLDDDWNDDYQSRDQGYDSLDSLDDEPSASGRSSRSSDNMSRSSRNNSSVQISSRYRGKESRMGIAVRGGYASLKGQNIQNENTGEMLRTSLGFVTYGAEVEVPLNGGATFRAGLEGHSTQRTVPEKLQHMGLPASIWNTITPLHAGVAYQFGKSAIRPNIGAEILGTPYSKEGFKMALGLRGRLGLDVMATRSFGIRIDGSMGFLYGSDFEMIESGLSSTTMAPQISFGTLFLL